MAKAKLEFFKAQHPAYPESVFTIRPSAKVGGAFTCGLHLKVRMSLFWPLKPSDFDQRIDFRRNLKFFIYCQRGILVTALVLIQYDY